ncbi:MAG: VWA domain-containing protein [Actinobacteria bacterium]|nr:VWA domain-containing protein [Actinomycetota bacterium]
MLPENKRKKIKLTFKALLVFLIISFISFLFQLNPTSNINLIAQDSGLSPKSNYDYILVIDESGSMKKNDPQNMRVDAAKLFVYLAEILNKGNRVLISGFGESTNVYLTLTEISGNEDDISSAINKIKSDQKLTDIKGALEKIKSILDGRQEKQKTAVIFLTDGSLTINDIPPQSQKGEKPVKEKPGKEKDEKVPPGQDKIYGNITESDKISEQLYAQEGENNDKDELPKSEKQYLEEYRQQLFDLCYKYKYENIVIYPIAFTKEADIELLEQIASITSGACWRAENASDIRNSFLEILKNLTSRFIRIEEQIEDEPLKGEIEVGDYIKELVALSLKNKIQPEPSINLVDPAGAQVKYGEFIQESIFKIIKIDEPEEGRWNYEVKGDAVFIYNIIDPVIVEPGYSIYITGAEVPIKIDISGLFEKNTEVSSSDFEVSCSVKYPQIGEAEDLKLTDDGKNADENESDGIFSGIYSSTEFKGNYLVAFELLHLPTSSISSSIINFEVVKLPVKISIIEPLQDFYLLNSDINVFVKLEQNVSSQQILNSSDYELTFNILYPDGKKSQNITLLDNGTGADVESKDGIFSFLILKPELEGKYVLEFFIRHIPSMFTPAATSQKIMFEVKSEPEKQVSTEESFSADVDITVHPEEEIETTRKVTQELPLYLFAIIIVISILAVAAIVLMVYFLYIRPKRRGF